MNIQFDDPNYLYLAKKKLKEIPKEIFINSDIEFLYLHDNNISEIPKEIENLSNLVFLSLSNNKISELPAEIGNLKKLQYLDLKGNNIHKLPDSFKNLKKIDFFDLSDNPIKQPPIEIQSQGGKAVAYYYLSTLFNSIPVYEAKLLIVGEGGVGKTTLLKRIIHNDIDNKQNTTEGIEIEKWIVDINEIKDFKINFWDFGGQEIYHATHQFFLTKRSLYLFVWEARKDDNLICFDYWLNIIKLLSNSSPVIIVLNKCDERIKLIDENSIKTKFNNVIAFTKVSAITGEGIPELIKLIKKEIIQLEHIGDNLPTTWIDIRKELEDLCKNYISHSEYTKICEVYNLNDKKVDLLSQYYHDLGVFLHFQDNDILRNIIFLNPEWATSAVYKLIDTKEIQSNCGKFNYYTLKKTWFNYLEDKFILLLELMKKFELCFQLPNSQDYIIPELLPANEPELHWSNTENLIFEYHYDFMPGGIITRFIVRIHDLIKDNLFWKNGVIISREDTEALIKCDYLNRKISINLKGVEKKELLSIVRREIDFIHKTLNYPLVSEMIPCNCKECINSCEPHLYKYSIIHNYINKKKKVITCPISVEDVIIEELLGRIEPQEWSKHSKNNIHIKSLTVHGQANIADEIDNINQNN